jgi:hypothetical protein
MKLLKLVPDDTNIKFYALAECRSLSISIVLLLASILLLVLTQAG